MTCSGYFLCYLQLHLTRAKDAKNVNIAGIYIGSLSIEGTSARLFSVAGVSIMGTYIGIGTELFCLDLLLLIDVILIK